MMNGQIVGEGASQISVESIDGRSAAFIGSIDESVELPPEGGNIQVLAGLERAGLEVVKARLAAWRAEREEAGFPAGERDLWAALNGEAGPEKELMERVALLAWRWE